MRYGHSQARESRIASLKSLRCEGCDKMPELRADYAPETCAFCEGTGKPSEIPEEKYYEWQLCPVCRGQGSVLVAQPARKCARCGGAGREQGSRLTCLACKGPGWALSLV